MPSDTAMPVRPQDYAFDLERALGAMVALTTQVPADALTAETLGTERAGNGVLIRDDGLVLTIGYLVAEAETIWITLPDGRALPGHLVGYDHETGFGLVQALARLDLAPLPLGDARTARPGERVVVAAAGGLEQALAARIVARQEFAGYWEYVLDEAIFTAPAHPSWGGAGLIGPTGELLGIGSLLVQQMSQDGRTENRNMFVPIDLLTPILDELLTLGRRAKPARPWLGLYATEVEDRVVIVSLARRGPAADADLRAGDIVLGVGGREVDDLAGLFRAIWAQGEAGAEVPLRIQRDGSTLEVSVRSADRRDYFKAPVAH